MTFLFSGSTSFTRGALRDELIKLVQREICGPHDDEEVIPDNPQTRYVCGQLAPLREERDGLDDESLLEGEILAGAATPDISGVEDLDAATETGDVDGQESAESSSISRARRDSLTSIGISFALEPGQAICYRARWGEYDKDELNKYRRSQREAEGTLRIENTSRLQSVDHGRVAIRWVTRSLVDRCITTVFLINITNSIARDGTDRLYQVELEVSCESANSGFLPRSETSDAALAFDIDDLLYRARREYAVGLHTAVEPIFDEAGRCRVLQTKTLPVVETRVTKSHNVAVESRALDMQWLAGTTDPTSTCVELSKLVREYKDWLVEIDQASTQLPHRFKGHAEAQRVQIACRISRFEAGIEVLRNNAAAFKAFRFANEALARAQFRASMRTAEGDPIDPRARKGTWRPFQIAFLVSTLSEIVAPTIEERRIVDVLFFPTGGGKTEAYLALSAFTMCFRRLSNGVENEGAGVSTLLRYTLRLLTTQQFTRAATLVCAAETIRRDRTFGELGPHPFSIGLWVGPMTPNTFDDAIRAAKQARLEHVRCVRNCDVSAAGREFSPKPMLGRETANLLPMTECPWCFTPVCIANVHADEVARRIVIKCPNTACSFSKKTNVSGVTIDGLPVYVVDEDVYRMVPTIVVATVDKFATLPFRGEAKSLFGNVSRFCDSCGFLTDAMKHKGHADRTRPIIRHRPIDLIIQDELHTITDNLGSIYGLYETAIDFLMTRNGVGPKYVCATATVKDVRRQIAGLYGNRRAEVFPPTGLTAGNTFFSTDDVPSGDSRGRAYVGIYAPTYSRLFDLRRGARRASRSASPSIRCSRCRPN